MEINRAGFRSIISAVTDLAKTLWQVHLLSVSPPRHVFFCLLGHHGTSTSRHRLRSDVEKLPTLSGEKTPGHETLIKVGFSLPAWCENIRHRHGERHALTHPHRHKFSPYAKHTHKPNEGLDSSRWKDSAGGCTFIKPRLDLFMFEVIRARERSLCAQTHSYTCFLITLASVFSLFLKTYWHVSIQQPRYITNEQF